MFYHFSVDKRSHLPGGRKGMPPCRLCGNGMTSDESPRGETEHLQVNPIISREKLLGYLKAITRVDITRDETTEEPFQCCTAFSRGSSDLKDIPIPKDFSNKRVVHQTLFSVVSERIFGLSPSDQIRCLVRLGMYSDLVANDYCDPVVHNASDTLIKFTVNRVVQIITAEAEGFGTADEKATSGGQNDGLESGDTFLSCVLQSGRNTNERQKLRYFGLLILLDFQPGVCAQLLRQLLRKCTEKYVSVALIAIEDLPHTRFLQQAICNSSFCQAWDILFHAETVLSRRKPAIFFQTTELGSLLALNAVAQVDIQSMSLKMNDAMKTILTKLHFTDLNKVIGTVTSGTETIVKLFGSLLKQQLLSEASPIHQHAFEWALTVLERNCIRLGAVGDCGFACSDAYMLTFCQALLFCFMQEVEDVHGKSCSEIPNLLCLCEYAVRVGVLPAIARCELLVQNSDRIDQRLSSDDSAKLKFILYRASLWYAPFIQKIAKFYNLFSEIMLHLDRVNVLPFGTAEEWNCFQEHSPLQLFESPPSSGSGSSSEVEDFSLTNDQIKGVIRRLTAWCGYCCRYFRAPENSDPQVCLDLCIQLCVHYLQRRTLPETPDTAASCVRAAAAFLRDDHHADFATLCLKRVWKRIFPGLIHCYVNASTGFGHAEEQTNEPCQPRTDLCILLYTIGSLTDPQNFITDFIQSGVSLNFLDKALETVVCLVDTFFSKNVYISRTQAWVCNLLQSPLSSEDKEMQKLSPKAKTCLSAIKAHLVLLHWLSSHDALAELMSRYPLSQRVASTIRCMVNRLCGPVDQPHCGKILPKCAALFLDFLLNITKQASSSEDDINAALMDMPSLKVENLLYSKMVNAADLHENKKIQLDHLISQLYHQRLRRLESTKSNFQ